LTDEQSQHYLIEGGPWTETGEKPMWIADCFTLDTFDEVVVGDRGTVARAFDMLNPMISNTNAGNNSSTNTNDPGNQNANTTPDPTAGWKTYSNTEHGFSVLHPSDVSVTTGTRPVATLKASSEYTTSSKHMVLFVEDRALNPSSLKGLFGQSVSDVTTTPVGSQTGYQFTEGNAGCGGIDVATSLRNSKTLYICLPSPQAVDVYNTWFSSAVERAQILSTFTFSN